MKINFKEYLTLSMQACRNEIIEYKDMISYMDKINSNSTKSECIKEAINHKECMLSAWESILKEL